MSVATQLQGHDSWLGWFWRVHGPVGGGRGVEGPQRGVWQ